MIGIEAHDHFGHSVAESVTDSARPTLWVLTVNYRSPSLVCKSLVALLAAIDSSDRVVVIDNASNDGSYEIIDGFVDAQGLRDVCYTLACSINGGFSYGNNRGVHLALTSEQPPDYVLLLNPDAVAQEFAVKELVSFMNAHPQVGMAGSNLINADGGQEASAHSFPSPLGELEQGARLGLLTRLLASHVVTPPQPTEAAPCDWVSGASMIIRTKVIEEIGLMDEGFFLYFEEVDFCKRAKAAGWECWYVPESRVMHLEGASTGIKEANKRRPRYWYDSRRRYFVKHHGVLGLVLADFLWATGRVTYLLRRALKLGAQGENRDPKLFMFDLLWGDLRAILSGNVFRIERFSK